MEVGFKVFGIPFRIGELTFLLFFCRLTTLDLKLTKVYKIGFTIIIILILNLILTTCSTFFSEFDKGFFYKYILRNSLYLIAISSFLIKPIRFEYIKFNFLIKYILTVVIFFYALEFIDYYLFSLGLENIYVDKQSKSVFHNFIIRFSGPSSEPAYVIPLLSIPLMYGLFKRKLNYIITSLVMILLTFSSFGYLVILFSIIYFLNASVDKSVKRKAKKVFFIALISMCFFGLVFINKVITLINYNWIKFQAYFGFGDVYEWSASQRAGHIKLGIDLFIESSFFKMLFGNGTGYYNKMSKDFTKFYLDDAEEAHNLFISTLTDRGIIGLLILLILFYVISKIKIPKNISDDPKFFFLAIKFGILVRMLHWFFTGMLWQHYFWVEVVLLISASIYYIKFADERK